MVHEPERPAGEPSGQADAPSGQADAPSGQADVPQDGAAENPYAQYHIVEKGDTLSKIAQQYYGDARLYPQIFEANRNILSDPNKIYPGQKLLIP